MMRQRVQAIMSDFDGTLVPTAKVKDPKTNAIPNELEAVLMKASTEIPICVISSKDFEFLRKKTTFAQVLSCMMGIETIIMTNPESPRTIKKSLLKIDRTIIQENSKALQDIAKEITSHKDFSNVTIEYKHTTNGMLAGLTVDWRHLSDWSYLGEAMRHYIARTTTTLRKAPVPADVYVQEYSTHPFLDIYCTECNKGQAFDIVVSELAHVGVESSGVLYLGDSENDNPAFRKAGISIGIHSDSRLTPKLDSSYFLSYGDLYSFLMKLTENDYLFTDELIMDRKI